MFHPGGHGALLNNLARLRSGCRAHQEYRQHSPTRGPAGHKRTSAGRFRGYCCTSKVASARFSSKNSAMATTHRVRSSYSSSSLASGPRRLLRTKSRGGVTPHSSSIGRYESVALSARSITPVAGRSGLRHRAAVPPCRSSRVPRWTSMTRRTRNLFHRVPPFQPGRYGMLGSRRQWRRPLISMPLSCRTVPSSPGRCWPVSPPSIYEHPGLWNGAMGLWNTAFVEIPDFAFNPVKSMADLWAPAHRP